MDVSGSSVLRDTAWGWDEKKECKRYEPLRESTNLEPVPVPKNREEALRLIGRAELEADPRMLVILDRSLAAFCTTDRRIAQLMQGDAGWRILRLNLPHTKSAAIRTIHLASEGCFTRCCRSSRPIVQEDTDSPHRDFLWQNLHVSHWKEALTRLAGEEDATIFTLAGDFLEDWKTREERTVQVPSETLEDWLTTRPTSQLLQYFIVFCIWDRERVSQAGSIACSLFAHLVQPSRYRSLRQEELQEFRGLVVRDPHLLQQLPSIFRDRLFLRCKGEKQKLETSRFLLDAHSSYFSALIETDPTASEFDLLDTVFTAKGMKLFLRWCTMGLGRTAGFGEDVSAQDLDQLLVTGAALGLTNEKIFQEILQIEYYKRISPDTLIGALQIAWKYRLQLLLGLCIHSINAYPSSNLRVHLQEDGSYLVEQRHELGLVDPPEHIFQALKHIPGIQKASISTFRRQRQSCGTSFLGGLSRMAGRVLALGSRMGGSVMGRFAKRVGVAAFSLWSVERMAGESWEHARDFPLASGAALVYPLVAAISQRCRARRRLHPLSVNLPHLLPLSTQRSFLRTQERVNRCVQSCRRRRPPSPERSLLARNHPLLEVLPENLAELSIVQAEDFTREDGLWVATHFTSLRELEMGEHPSLEPEDWNFLQALAPRLQKLTFTFGRGQQPRGLNQVALHQLLQEGNLTVEVSLFDSTVVYAPIQFLQTVSENMRLHVTLRHAPMADHLILFEAPAGYTSDWLGWPELFAHVRAAFPRIDRLDCYAPMRDEDVTALLPSLRTCTSLQIHQGSEAFTGQGLRQLAETCPLRELRLGMVDVGNMGIASLAEHAQSLERISLFGVFGVTDTAFAHLVTLPQLRECYLFHLSRITDAGITTLLRSKTLQECLVYDCDDISSQLASDLLSKSLRVRQGQVQNFQKAWERTLSRSIPQESAKATIAFLAVQSVLTLGKELLSEERLALLGVQQMDRGDITITLSMAEAAARLYPESFSIKYFQSLLEKRKSSLQEKLSAKRSVFDPIEGREALLFGWATMMSASQEFYQTTSSMYEGYLQAVFLAGFSLAVKRISTDLIRSLEKTLRFNNGQLKRELQEFVPSVFLHVADGVRPIQEWWRLAPERNPFFKLLQEHIQNIRTEGDAHKWSDEQRLLAVFAPLFLHLDVWVKLFAVPEAECRIEEKERKEEKKESKKREKEPPKSRELSLFTE